MPDTDQREVNRQLFELLVSVLHRVNALTWQVAAVRAILEQGGSDPVPPAAFANVVTAVQATLPADTGETARRIQQLVQALKLPTQ